MSEKKDIDKDKETNEKLKTLQNVALSGAAVETVQRYGSAVKEHIVSFSGMDNETGKVLKKGLKSISKESVHPDYKEINLKQQAGFSAEVKQTARENAERIIKKNPNRVTRTDDIGRVNDPLYDHVEIDNHGNIIQGSGSQMKFVGKNPREALNKLTSKEYSKYFDADVDIVVPSDFYEGIKKEAQQRITELEKQIERLKKEGKEELVNQKLQEIEKYKKIDEKVKKGRVSNKDAMEARLNPELSTAKDILKVSHRAGVEQFKTGVAISGGISVVKNIVNICKGEKDVDEAVKDCLIDTAKGGAFSYSTAFAGSTVKGIMQNSKSQLTRVLSKTNLPGIIVLTTVETGKVFSKLIKGEITGVECVQELGETGAGMISSAMFSVIGQAVIPIPIAGAIIGSMVGYALSSAFYSSLRDSLLEAKKAHEERLRIEKECLEAIQMIKEYRSELEDLINHHISEKIEIFKSIFGELTEALETNDIEQFITGTNRISETFGKKPLFSNLNEFDQLMNSSNSLKI